MKATLTGLGFVLCFAIAPFASATTVNFTTGSTNAGTMGNSLCYTAGGAATSCNGSQFLMITAWGITGGAGGDTTFAQGALGHYAGTDLGLGVCNQDEGVNCNPPNHEVDNSGHDDFVLFQFNTPVSNATVVLNPVCNCGYTDSTYYTGTGSAAISGLSLAQLSTVGFGSGTNRNGGNSQQTFTLSGSGYTSILLGADVAGPHFGDDYFKIGSLTWTTGNEPPGTPEPSSVISLGTGLGLLVCWARRKRGNSAC